MNASNHQLNLWFDIHPPIRHPTFVYPFMHPQHTNHSNHKFLLNLKLFFMIFFANHSFIYPSIHSLRYFGLIAMYVCVHSYICMYVWRVCIWITKLICECVLTRALVICLMCCTAGICTHDSFSLSTKIFLYACFFCCCCFSLENY